MTILRFALFVLLASAAWPAAAQLSIEYPRAPVIEPAKTDRDKEAEEEAQKIVYSGDPLLLPPPCDPALLEAAYLQCSDGAPCEISAEILGAARAGDRLWAFGDFRTSSATVASLLVVSEDGGETWTPPLEPIPGAALEAVEIEDADHGFLAGQRETGGATRQPFFAAMRDGGLYWQTWDVTAGQEERGGVIADFRFDGPEHGYLILERLSTDDDPFELYETYNGARSWSVRQISAEMPRMPGARRLPSVPDWRVEKQDGLYLIIEKNQSEPTARFVEHVGSCPATTSD